MGTNAQIAPLTDMFAELTPKELGLLDVAPEPAFDTITRLASKLCDAPTALVSIIDEAADRQFFKSQLGMTGEAGRKRQTPLSQSFCKYVAASNKPLIISDSRKDKMAKTSGAYRVLGVMAYLGVPICTPDGQAIGALCVIDKEPRQWRSEDTQTLEELAAMIGELIMVRASNLVAQSLHDRTKDQLVQLSNYHRMHEAICQAFMAPDLPDAVRMDALLEAGCAALGMDRAMVARVDCDICEILHMTGTQPQPKGELATEHHLVSRVVRGRGLIAQSEPDDRSTESLPDLSGKVPRSYLAAPLLVDGLLFGVVEMSSDTSRRAPFSEEELALFTMMTLFAGGYLGLFNELSALRRSETALVEYLAELKAQWVQRSAPRKAETHATASLPSVN